MSAKKIAVVKSEENDMGVNKVETSVSEITTNNNINNSIKIGPVIYIIAIVITFIVFYAIADGWFEKKGISNTTFTDTDGYKIVVKTNSCHLEKDGRVLGNECTYSKNSGGSGIGKLTVCNAYGIGCDSIEISNKKYKKIYIFGRFWYK